MSATGSKRRGRNTRGRKAGTHPPHKMQGRVLLMGRDRTPRPIYGPRARGCLRRSRVLRAHSLDRATPRGGSNSLRLAVKARKRVLIGPVLLKIIKIIKTVQSGVCKVLNIILLSRAAGARLPQAMSAAQAGRSPFFRGLFVIGQKKWTGGNRSSKDIFNGFFVAINLGPCRQY